MCTLTSRNLYWFTGAVTIKLRLKTIIYPSPAVPRNEGK